MLINCQVILADMEAKCIDEAILRKQYISDLITDNIAVNASKAVPMQSQFAAYCEIYTRLGLEQVSPGLGERINTAMIQKGYKHETLQNHFILTEQEQAMLNDPSQFETFDSIGDVILGEYDKALQAFVERPSAKRLDDVIYHKTTIAEGIRTLRNKA